MRPLMITTAVMTVALLSFTSGCSWISWQKIPEKDAPAEKIECSSTPPTVDTVITGINIVGVGVFSGLAAHACDGGGELCGVGVMVWGIVAGSFAVVAAIWGAASMSGWVHYDNCREYQERVSSTEQFGTGPELFHPSSLNPPPPNSVPSGSAAPPNPGTSIPDP